MKWELLLCLYGEDQLQANGPWMLFRQVGFENVKILLGGFQYYAEHKDDLLSTKDDNSFLKGEPRFDYAEKAAPKEGTVSTTAEKQPVQVQRRQKNKRRCWWMLKNQRIR